MTSRISSDRRAATLRTAINSIYRNRRVDLRRSTDVARDIYLDKHEPLMAFLALGVVILSITDAFFTLHLLKHGGEEISPFMDYLLQKDTLLFFTVKYLITAVAVLIVLMHKNFRIFKYFLGYHGLYLMFLSYVILISYELSLLAALNYFPGVLSL